MILKSVLLYNRSSIKFVGGGDHIKILGGCVHIFSGVCTFSTFNTICQGGIGNRKIFFLLFFFEKIDYFATFGSSHI